MTISEKVAYLKGLAEGLNLDVEKSKEGKLISVMIGILEEVGLSIEDLEENALALGRGDRRHFRRPGGCGVRGLRRGRG